jgi:murein L,D-transpeptidase YcbB/YkuD
MLRLYLVLVCFLPTWKTVGQGGEVLRGAVKAEVQSGPTELEAVYRNRAFDPIWINELGKPGTNTEMLIHILATSDSHGLDTEKYGWRDLQAVVRRLQTTKMDARGLAEADVALSRAMLLYLTDVYFGRILPEIVHPGWRSVPDRAHFEHLLVGRWFEGDLDVFFARFEPPYREYARLREALANYRRINDRGGWPILTGITRLARGDSSEAVHFLRERLDAEPGMSTTGRHTGVFDAEVQGMVVEFQRRHGLDQDGIVGHATLAALNVPVQQRIRQIELSMERWRWMPKQPADRYLTVDVGGGSLNASEHRTTLLRMKVIVGSRRTPTPIFHTSITGVVAAPYWNVPRSIATGEILPKLRRNPSYLAANHMRLFLNGREVNASGIDWSSIKARRFPYQIRQDPGAGNPMGRIKFVFPNAYGVGLHDTSEPWLFAQSSCNFSHGCIRLENPMDLALFALQGAGGWTAERLNAIIDKGNETTINLPAPIPVYVMYWTAWADAEVAVHFRDDVYGHDLAMERAFERCK